MRRVLAASLAALLFMLVGPNDVSAAPAPSPTSYAAAAFAATNTARMSHHRGVLRGNACLQRFAELRARRAANLGDTLLPHAPLPPIQRSCGMGYVGENLAYGHTSGRATVRAWMRSTDGHRKNILSRHFKLMGLAAVKKDGFWWAAQVFGRKN